ncbi:hypothetical protein D3C84_540420 [compost metagenome]
MHLWRLLGGLDVVGHCGLEPRIRIRLQPLAAHGVLHQILDDPVGGEQLGGSGDVLTLHHLADDLILLLGDVELVEPADDLHVMPVLVGNGAD